MIYRTSSARCKSKRGRFIHYEAPYIDDTADSSEPEPISPLYWLSLLAHRHETIADLITREPEWDTPVHSVLTIADCHVIRDAIIKAGISPVPGVMTIRYRVNNGCDILTGELV